MDGGVVENVTFDDIEVAGFQVPVFVRGGTRKGRACGTPPSDWHVLRNVTISNVRGRAHAKDIDPTKPFFYVQHEHPKDTCFGAWAWGHDDGRSTRALSAFPNAIAFSGHSHYSLTDERTVWQGAFTSCNTASLFDFSMDYALREKPCAYLPRGGSRFWMSTRRSPLCSWYPFTA